MKPGAIPLGVFVAVCVWPPAGCGSDGVVPRPEAGFSATDAGQEATAVMSWLDGGSENAGTATDGDPTEARDIGDSDSPWCDGGGNPDVVAREAAGDEVEADTMDAPAGEGDLGRDAEVRRDTPPDTGEADARSALLDGDDGDTGQPDVVDAPQPRDVSNRRADAAGVKEVAPSRDTTDPAEGGSLPDGGGDRIWVYLLAGQSNMVGVGNRQQLSREDAALVPSASIYYSDPLSWNQQAEQWLPLGPGFGVTTDYFGPELAFARRMHELHPRRRLAVIKVAEGGTGLFDRWKATTGDLYQLLLRVTQSQLGVLAADGRPQLAGLVWMQGESDALARIQADAYQQNLTDFITALRTDLGSALLPVVAGLIAKDHGWAFADEVREATRQVAAQLGRTEVVETDDLRMDWDGNVHYDADGNLRLGYRFATALDTMQAARWRFPEDFATVQGEGCFRYRDRTDTGAVPLAYDDVSTRWVESGSDVAIGEGFMIPGMDHQAELAFWAPFAGDIEVTLRTTIPSAASAGVEIEAASRSEVLVGPAGLAFPTAVWLSFHLAVAQGDEILFRTSPGPRPDPDNDATNWQIDIAMTRVDE